VLANVYHKENYNSINFRQDKSDWYFVCDIK